MMIIMLLTIFPYQSTFNKIIFFNSTNKKNYCYNNSKHIIEIKKRTDCLYIMIFNYFQALNLEKERSKNME
jgi:hypothetical protein